METCIDDVLKAPGVPAAMAADEAGPSSTYAVPNATGEDSLNLNGEVTLSPDGRKSWIMPHLLRNRAANRCLSLRFSSEAAARLKQLELESSPLPVTPRNNINLNMALNNQVIYPFLYIVCIVSVTQHACAVSLQEDVVKITEKCSLSSTASSSPGATPLRTPEDLKSNILKAQAEAAAVVVRDAPTVANGALEAQRVQMNE